MKNNKPNFSNNNETVESIKSFNYYQNITLNSINHAKLFF